MLFLGGRLELDWLLPQVDCGDILVEDVGVAASLSEAETGVGMGPAVERSIGCSTSVAILDDSTTGGNHVC